MNPEDIRVLAACEESQAVCKAFRKRGFSAWSCDIQDCSGGHPEWHIKGDVIPLLREKWDLIIAFPPCTDLASSGARWFEQKRKDGRQKKSIDFFFAFTLVVCDHVAIENPIGIMSTLYRKPDQIINPYEHGDPVRKSTCLWLKNLPELEPTKIVDAKLYRSAGKTYSGPAYYARDENGKIIPWNDPRTAKIRSKTYQGIAQAMAQQWGDYLLEATL